MDFEKLTGIIFDGLAPILENHRGAQLFARERAQFDDWLKVELCRVLAEAGHEPEPDKGKVEIAVDVWALEARTINTNIPCEGAKNKKLKASKNVDALIKDIWKLTSPGKAIAYAHRGVVFLAFPTAHDNERWQTVHLNRISSELTQLERREFNFADDLPGVLYFGRCSDS